MDFGYANFDLGDISQNLTWDAFMVEWDHWSEQGARRHCWVIEYTYDGDWYHKRHGWPGSFCKRGNRMQDCVCT